MDTLEAMARGDAARRAGNKTMVFDWYKAATLIRERQPKVARAGLRSDWEWTGGEIYRDGRPVTDAYTFLASYWATPELDIDGEVVDCFVYAEDTDGWDQHTKWPETALKILEVGQ